MTGGMTTGNVGSGDGDGSAGCSVSVSGLVTVVARAGWVPKNPRIASKMTTSAA